MIAASHPIFTCAEAGKFEKKRFAGDEAKEWLALQNAGEAVAAGIRDDYREIGGLPAGARILVLVGKGHNGGDASLAAAALARDFPALRIDVIFALGERGLRPLAARAYRELQQVAGSRLTVVSRTGAAANYDLSIDGVFGFQFRPPVDAELAEFFAWANALPVRLRAAVDLPSADLFKADFTYATGSVKDTVVRTGSAGRIRYLDLGFFSGTEKGADRVLTQSVLEPLRRLRAPTIDKRTQGHLLVLGGSRSYPGAVMMTVLAALRSGAGLVTAFIPASLVPAYAARAPEAMWVAWPETTEGSLSRSGLSLLQPWLPRATAFVVGPGLGREDETLALVADVVRTVKVPVLLDADALQPEIVLAAKASLVLTPHAGEFERIAGARGPDGLRAYARKRKAVVVLKGPVTRISAGSETYHSFFGGPVLARGGSGDLLAGLIGGLIAQTPKDLSAAAARGVVWHGLAADFLARDRGQTAVRTTELLDYLAPALRSS